MKMKRIITVVFVAVFALAVSQAALAAEFGTPAQAEAMVKKAVAEIKANGKDKAFAEISNPKGKFIDRDLYVFVYDMSGKCVAHGFNQKMIGKELIDMKDPDGKFYVKERVEIAKTKGKGWQDYKFTNPLSKKVENKTAYIEKVDDLIVGCGAYKK
jgi:signal transduction histidine kinase